VSDWRDQSDLDLDDSSFELASTLIKWRTMIREKEKIPAQFTK